MTASFFNPLFESDKVTKTADPCILVIFGATGDLTERKLFPALYNLERGGLLSGRFACIGIGRREKSSDQFRDEMHRAVSTYSRQKPIDENIWREFREKVFYHVANFDDDDGYLSLKQLLEQKESELGTKGNCLFYLSTQPSYFPQIIKKLGEHQLIHPSHEKKLGWSRVIIEKPFGHDLESSLNLQREIVQTLDESQIYRIDHYLGKETVQNLLVFRFSNPIFESVWNSHYIDSVQITVAEDMGIGTRGRFFEEAGMLRDIVQNHMMQLVSLVAMEPPTSLHADAIHNEKVKVLHAIRPFAMDKIEDLVVRGQYGPGYIYGESVKGYREENNVDPESKVETYVALQLHIDNWRWSGVPFFLRAGKRLPKRATEIAIIFKKPPQFLFESAAKKLSSDILVIRIQPDEGISLKMNCKVPGLASVIQPVKMDFKYDSHFGAAPPEAYERLICDAMLGPEGDRTLFARDDEVFASWKLLNPILEYWYNTKASPVFPNYVAGSWGPDSADHLLMRQGKKWRLS